MALAASVPVSVDNVTIKSNPVAVIQPTTYTDVTVSRSPNTAYQNTSGKIMYVYFSGSVSAGGTQIKTMIGSTNNPTQTTCVFNSPVIDFIYNFFAVVPNNWYYKFANTGGTLTLALCAEQT